MPWTCRNCQTKVNDDVAECPECAQAKTSWSIQANQTRTMKVERNSFTLLRGEGEGPATGGGELPSPLVRATEARSVPKDLVAALRKRGLWPAVAHTLFVKLTGKRTQKADVVLEVFPPKVPPEDVVEGPAPEDEHVRVLFIHGQGDRPEVPGLHVVDVTDASADSGHAESVEVSVLRLDPQRLSLTAVELPAFPFSL